MKIGWDVWSNHPALSANNYGLLCTFTDSWALGVYVSQRKAGITSGKKPEGLGVLRLKVQIAQSQIVKNGVVHVLGAFRVKSDLSDLSDRSDKKRLTFQKRGGISELYP